MNSQRKRTIIFIVIRVTLTVYFIVGMIALAIEIKSIMQFLLDSSSALVAYGVLYGITEIIKCSLEEDDPGMREGE